MFIPTTEVVPFPPPTDGRVNRNQIGTSKIGGTSSPNVRMN